jgi:2'-5' RNA ligase
VQACASVAPFSMRLAAAALAPPSRPRMIWAQLEAPSDLADLAHAVATSAEPFAQRARPPRTGSPHVTLARFRHRQPRAAELPPLAAAGTEIAVAGCELVRSHLEPGGSHYTTLAALPLGRS